MRVVTLLLAIVLAARPAQAQDYSSANLERRASRTGVLATLIPVAAGAALIATSKEDGGGLAIASFGLVIGPALGYQEARMGGRGWRGAGLRTGLLLGSFVGAIAVCWDCTKDQELAAGLVFTGGIALVTASAIYDLSRLRHNIRRHEARRLSFAPFYAPTEQRVGLGAHVSF